MEYTYIDNNHHQVVVNQRMLYSTGVICAECGDLMWRKPGVIRINWGGLKPSEGELSPKIKNMINGAEERRETGKRLEE
jgi:hypothetical protein